ncbi:MAG: DUF4340 domain-containing protein [Acidobacteriia bacterium]|nr:DUF4340 domain-containing protein [Terriglobia bacterium]
MRNETARTAIFALAAAGLVGGAAYLQPITYSPEIFSDQGEVFFPEFRDVMAVKAIEVVGYDEAEATARPLKVEFRKGRWVLTSHSDYPAEAKDRLAKTASALLDLKREIVVSDRMEDQGRYGVIDPLDTRSASLTGRGKRVTLRDAQGAMLAELILGDAMKEKPGYRYVRTPGAKRTYAVKTDAEASARFEDWVESDLLKVSAGDVEKITVNSYTLDEMQGRLLNMQRTVMVRDKENWNAQAKSIAAALSSLRVVGARPKPPSLAQQLRSKQLSMTLENVMSLRQRGYIITPDGRLLAKYGELLVETSKGLVYQLRFGEVVGETSASGKPSENRFLFVTVGTKTPETETLASALHNKFADWYYVISAADFARIRPGGTPQMPSAQQAPVAPPATAPSTPLAPPAGPPR